MIRHHADLIQGSEEWLAARCGLLTASEMKLILTPTLAIARNEHTRAHVYELLAQRISQYVEPHYISADMLRGQEDEIEARALYAQHYAPVEEAGFITNDRWGFTIGYSPDGLVGADGLIECVPAKRAPSDYLLQVQTGLLVSERSWCDLVSYSGGLPLAVIRVHPMPEVQEAILAAAQDFEAKVAAGLATYRDVLADLRPIPTERRIEQEMFVA